MPTQEYRALQDILEQRADEQAELEAVGAARGGVRDDVEKLTKKRDYLESQCGFYEEYIAALKETGESYQAAVKLSKTQKDDLMSQVEESRIKAEKVLKGLSELSKAYGNAKPPDEVYERVMKRFSVRQKDGGQTAVWEVCQQELAAEQKWLESMIANGNHDISVSKEMVAAHRKAFFDKYDDMEEQHDRDVIER